MEKFTPAFIRKQQRAKERREAKAQEAAARVVAFLNRLFKEKEAVYSPGPADPRSKKEVFVCKWGRWEVFYGRNRDYWKCFIFSHPLYGVWEASVDYSLSRKIESLLKEGGLNV